MAWQRKIPFGYTVESGKYVRCETEAVAVRSIYAMSRRGSSYSQIAAEMERRCIPYHAHTPQWNKNMVKRILENPRYLGQGGFPELISNEDYRAVGCQKADKTGYTPSPASIRPIRKKAVCGLCGAKISRDTRNRYPRWICQNADCGHRSFIPDVALQNQVEQILREFALEPQRLAYLPAPKARELSRDAIRIRNELTHALNRGDADTEYMKAMVFAAAAERYKSLSDPMSHYHLERLRKRLEQDDPDADDLRELFTCMVQEVRIADNAVELLLVNGTTLGKIEREEQTV